MKKNTLKIIVAIIMLGYIGFIGRYYYVKDIVPKNRENYYKAFLKKAHQTQKNYKGVYGKYFNNPEMLVAQGLTIKPFDTEKLGVYFIPGSVPREFSQILPNDFQPFLNEEAYRVLLVVMPKKSNSIIFWVIDENRNIRKTVGNSPWVK